jgi:hypothetical protein
VGPEGKAELMAAMREGFGSDVDGPIRCSQRPWVAVAMLAFGPIFIVGPTAAAVAALVSWGVGAPGHAAPPYAALLLLVMAGLFGSQFHGAWSWVELDGTTLRAQRFWTRAFHECSVAEIVDVRVVGWLRDEGYGIRCSNGLTVRLLRRHMGAVDLLANELQRRRTSVVCDAVRAERDKAEHEAPGAQA